VSHRTIYAVVGLVVGILLVVLLVTWDYSTDDKKADEKAGELIAAYQKAGLPVRLDRDQLADLLGDDGGDVCQLADDVSDSDSYEGYVKTTFRVGGEFGFAGATLDRDALDRAELVVETYCPDKLGAARDFIHDLEDRNVVKD
jgi:type II secretory pathway pseudopilin PulG